MKYELTMRVPHYEHEPKMPNDGQYPIWQECAITVDDNKITVDDRWLPIKLEEFGEWALRIRKRFIAVNSLDIFKRYCDIDGAFACYGWRICEQVLKYGKPV